jgi:hypothetical protein
MLLEQFRYLVFLNYVKVTGVQWVDMKNLADQKGMFPELVRDYIGLSCVAVRLSNS